MESMDWQDFFMGKRVFFTKPASGEIHLYHVERVGRRDNLSEFEKERYESYGMEGAARIFLKGRSALREIGAIYTGKTPWVLDVEVAGGGKPFFRNVSDLHFNVSHSGEELSVAFSSEPVGLDLENKDRKGDFVGLAKRFFHPEERAEMERGGEGRGFLELWTAKEAMLKLVGKGIAVGLEQARVMENGEAFFGSTRIFLHRFVTKNCLGALASFSPIKRVNVATY